MSKDYSKGRADAAGDDYDPPSDPWGVVGELIEGKKGIERMAERRAEYDEGYNDKIREIEEEDDDKKDSGGCFVTTACVETLGLPDDCHEMTVLRRFRDFHLLSFEIGRKAVVQYYQIAPRIVAAIRHTEHPEAEFYSVYKNWIQPAVALVEAGNYAEAFEHYRECIVQLAQKYGISDTIQ